MLLAACGSAAPEEPAVPSGETTEQVPSEPMPSEPEDPVLSPEERWQAFLASGDTAAYTTEYEGALLEYALADLNADGIPELLIQAVAFENWPWHHTWIFALDGDGVVLASAEQEAAELEEGDLSGTDMTGYGSFRYSPSRNAVVGTPGFQPFDGVVTLPCYRLTGTNLKYAFEMTHDRYDELPYYYSDDRGRVEISETEWQDFLDDLVVFDWAELAVQ